LFSVDSNAWPLTASGKNVLSKQRAGWREFVEAINLITGIQHARF